MNPANISLDEFVADSGRKPAASIFPMEDTFVQPGTGLNLPNNVLAEAEGYRIVEWSGGDVVAIDAGGNEAGFYSSNTLAVHHAHRGRQLSVGLALWAHQLRSTVPLQRSLSDGGRAALRKAWLVARGEASNAWWPA